MTQTDTVFVPTGHPVARFVTAIVVTAVMLVAIWLSGLVAPRVQVSGFTGQYNTVTNRGDRTIEVHNQGLFRITVDRARATDRWVSMTGVSRADIDGDKTGTVTIGYAVDCDGFNRARTTTTGAVTPSVRLRLHVEGPVAGRWVTYDDGEVAGRCGEPIGPS